MLGGSWFDHRLRGAGGSATVHRRDHQRKRDSLEKRPLHPFVIERLLEGILQFAIAVLLGGICGFTSVGASIAGILGCPLYLGIVVAAKTLYEYSSETPVFIAQSTLWKGTGNHAIAFFPIIASAGVPLYGFLPWPLLRAALSQMWGVFPYQVAYGLLWLPPLARLERPTAVYVVDILDKVCDCRSVASRRAYADFHPVFVSVPVFLPSGMLQARSPPPAVTLRVVGGIAYFLHASYRSAVIRRTSVRLLTWCRSVQGEVERGTSRCEGSHKSSVRRFQ